jgi:hypothetical protein
MLVYLDEIRSSVAVIYHNKRNYHAYSTRHTVEQELKSRMPAITLVIGVYHDEYGDHDRLHKEQQQKKIIGSESSYRRRFAKQD